MQVNFSLILNVVLLIVVMIAIIKLFKSKQVALEKSIEPPSLGQSEHKLGDDIIAIRRLNIDIDSKSPDLTLNSSTNFHSNRHIDQPTSIANSATSSVKKLADKTLMLFLQTKNNRLLAGYDLLQTVLASGLRFGEGHLFHCHEQPNGQGPILFSLAAATSSGVFDLQNIDTFNVKGLCLFMQPSGDKTVDTERLTMMFDVAKQLSQALDTRLLDDQQCLLTDDNRSRYYQCLEKTVG